jgi:hypothetical protein
MPDIRRKYFSGPSVWISTTYSTNGKIHRIAVIIGGTSEEKQHCSTAFLDIMIQYGTKDILPHAYNTTYGSCLTERLFQVKFKDEPTNLRKTEAGVPQGSVL